MRIKQIHRLLLLAIFMLVASFAEGQSNEVSINSWKWGEERVYPQIFEARITAAEPGFEREFYVKSGKRYLFSVVRNPDVSLKHEHWKLMLNEIDLTAKTNKDHCRDLLYATTRCETGGDHFSSKDDFGFIVPTFDYEPTNLKVPRLDRIPVYPPLLPRKILVDGFLMTIKVGDIKLDPKDKSKVESFELSVQLENVSKKTNLKAKPKYFEES